MANRRKAEDHVASANPMLSTRLRAVLSEEEYFQVLSHREKSEELLDNQAKIQELVELYTDNTM